MDLDITKGLLQQYPQQHPVVSEWMKVKSCADVLWAAQKKYIYHWPSDWNMLTDTYKVKHVNRDTLKAFQYISASFYYLKNKKNKR